MTARQVVPCRNCRYWTVSDTYCEWCGALLNGGIVTDTRVPQLAEARRLLAALVDPDECWFDHNGGCQAHGFLSLEPGEVCPNELAKRLLAAEPEERPA